MSEQEVTVLLMVYGLAGFGGSYLFNRFLSRRGRQFFVFCCLIADFHAVVASFIGALVGFAADFPVVGCRDYGIEFGNGVESAAFCRQCRRCGGGNLFFTV